MKITTFASLLCLIPLNSLAITPEEYSIGLNLTEVPQVIIAGRIIWYPVPIQDELYVEFLTQKWPNHTDYRWFMHAVTDQRGIISYIPQSEFDKFVLDISE